MDDLVPGTRVRIPFGLDTIEAEVDHVYGPPERRHVLVWLTPELSEIVVEPETMSVPLERVTRATPAT